MGKRPTNAEDGYSEALNRIKASLKVGGDTLDLSWLHLEALPPEIGRLTELTTLIVGGNELTTLPPEIGQLAALTTLDLGGNQLATLPPEIGHLSALRTLDLGAEYDTCTDGHTNRLATLPPEIGNLTAMTELFVSANDLSILPPEIGKLNALRKLDLSHNQLTILPPTIGDLRKLTTLTLSRNQLASLPPEIGELKALTWLGAYQNQLHTLPREVGQLKALTTFNLDENKLTKLPAEFGGLSHLTELRLSHNRLTNLPPEIGQLRALKSLYLTYNQLATLPAEIGQLHSLTVLGLSRNGLVTLPPELAQLGALMTLDLSANLLESLPDEIGKLRALKRLYLHRNPVLGIPDSILGSYSEHLDYQHDAAERPSDILNFYFARWSAAEAGTLRRLNEIKVMLVGRGGAGKTSLRRFFMNEPHDKDEKETPGIALDTFQLCCGNESFTVRLWDFAGQEITHALHQFFLTEGCIYLLVLDPRSNTEGRDAEYWLNLLNRYARGAPVLVALNRQDARQGGYDVDQNALSERFPVIQAFVPTNCEKREGCDELRHALIAAIETLGKDEPPHLKVPEAWLKVKDECFEMRNANPMPKQGYFKRLFGLATEKELPKVARQHLTLEEFRELCKPHGVIEEAKQESLARLLHKLGAVLHFIDEPRLRDTTVLNPHWVTDGVYRLLRAKDRPGSDGVLTLADALAALPGETEATVRFLLRLMERFEMCFPVDQQVGDKAASKWLVPGALTEFQPKGIGTEWQQTERVRLRYQYDPLPEGVIPRFIVMTNPLSDGRPRWRNGVVLQDANARALVRRARENFVEVTAIGPEKERLRLLEIVQGNLERIHADLPRPKPVAEMELAGLPDTFRLVADLEAAEVRKQPMAVKTDSGDELVQPTEQLNRTSEPEARDGSRLPLHVFLSYSHKDKSAKNIFQDNLTVMQQKKFIAPWHDGLIEPGMRWKEEIEESLQRMDVFVGLLTTAFLASNFIQTVELKAARAKHGAKGSDFLFVLVLVDDIPLAGLDLAEYQILKPAGKAVTQHTNRRAGFNAAQAELENLFKRLQEEKVARRGDDFPTRHSRT